MAKLDVVSLGKKNAKKGGSLELSQVVFEAPLKPHLVHAEVRRQLAARRRGTHATKNRHAVSGGGAKPWRQKGTGPEETGRQDAWEQGFNYESDGDDYTLTSGGADKTIGTEDDIILYNGDFVGTQGS